MCSQIKKTKTLYKTIVVTTLIFMGGCKEEHSKSTVPEQKPIEVVQVVKSDNNSPQYVGFYTAQHIISVSSLREGKIKSILVNEGENIHKNDILAIMHNTDSKLQLAQAQNELEVAHANTLQLSDLVKRSNGLDAIGALSTSAIKDRQSALSMARAKEKIAQEAKKLSEIQEQQTIIRAPEDGTIIKISTQPGALAGIGNEIVVLAAGVPEIDVELYDSQSVNIGEKAEINFMEGAHAITVRGEVVRISPYFDPDTKVRHAWVSLKTPLPIPFNTSVFVKFSPQQEKNLVRIPLTALFYIQDAPYVWRISNDKQHIKEQRITIITLSGQDAIVTGLLPEQLVVSNGPDLLRHEDIVKIVQMDDHS
ncbi:efflux RND transporter periplasmic adaptor subunit [Acetobacter ascendens]|uniref:Multidrug resistance protein MdtA n=1 Tax=Acetobacter ascendens TaxID=481146 RepID=A0A1Y0V6A8_9PROT|nr:efflux RND transporter periplasmic adaptor subunit [Acetobacter ascendens]ARW11626.1 Multidrug resistance protein MdtA [Acetobacter ascendens]